MGSARRLDRSGISCTFRQPAAAARPPGEPQLLQCRMFAAQSLNGGKARAVRPVGRTGARPARRRTRPHRQRRQPVGAGLPRPARSQLGRILFLTTAPNWWSARSRACRPACAFRSTRASAAPPRARGQHPARRRRARLPRPYRLRCGVAFGTGGAAVRGGAHDDAASALIGVFDLDSPLPARFDVEDQQGLEAIARVFVESLS